MNAKRIQKTIEPSETDRRTWKNYLGSQKVFTKARNDPRMEESGTSNTLPMPNSWEKTDEKKGIKRTEQDRASFWAEDEEVKSGAETEGP